jgi:type IV secretion system protein VirB1
MAKARELIRAGRDFDAGVGQINVRNWRWLGVTVETVFNPADNIAAQCRLLQSYSRYNTGSPVRGVANGYVGRIVRGAASVREVARQSAASTPRRDANACPSRSRVAVWGTSPRQARCRSG